MTFHGQYELLLGHAGLQIETGIQGVEPEELALRERWEGST
jgi:hypothetical protein